VGELSLIRFTGDATLPVCFIRFTARTGLLLLIIFDFTCFFFNVLKVSDCKQTETFYIYYERAHRTLIRVN
jgi:hypothetical protein